MNVDFIGSILLLSLLNNSNLVWNDGGQQCVSHIYICQCLTNKCCDIKTLGLKSFFMLQLNWPKMKCQERQMSCEVSSRIIEFFYVVLA